MAAADTQRTTSGAAERLHVHHGGGQSFPLRRGRVRQSVLQRRLDPRFECVYIFLSLVLFVVLLALWFARSHCSHRSQTTHANPSEPFCLYSPVSAQLSLRSFAQVRTSHLALSCHFSLPLQRRADTRSGQGVPSAPTDPLASLQLLPPHVHMRPRGKLCRVAHSPRHHARGPSLTLPFFSLSLSFLSEAHQLFELMVNFLYTDEIPLTEKNVTEILVLVSLVTPD